MKDKNIFGVHGKVSVLRRVHEKPIYRGGFPNQGGLGQFSDLKGGGDLTKKRGAVFLRGGDTPMHTL